MIVYINRSYLNIKKYILLYGVIWESNPRPLAPKARIIPLDQWPINIYLWHYGRVVKAVDLKSIGIFPRRFKSCWCRYTIILLYIKRYIVMRHPGIEPGPHRWQRRILTTELMALNYILIIYSIIYKYMI